MTGQFPSPRRNLGQYRSQQDAASRTGEAEGAARLGESAEAGDAEAGAPGGGGRRSRQRKRPGPLASRGCWAAGLPGSQSPSRVSAAANLSEAGGGDQQHYAKRRSQGHGGDGRGGGSRRRDPGRPTRLPPWPCPRRLLRAGQRPWRPCGRMGALPPPGILRGASAAFPGRRTADTRPRLGEREGAGGRAGGRGQARRSAPWLASLRPRLAGLPPRRPGPLPSRQSRGAPSPLPQSAHRVGPHCQARPPPDMAGRPRIPKDEVSIWDPQQVPGKQSLRSRPQACAAPS